MENRGGRSGRGGRRHGEVARGGGAGGRRGRRHNREQERGPGHAAAGDPPRNGEEGNVGGGRDRAGGRGRHNGDESPQLGGPAGEGDSDEGNASGGGGPGGRRGRDNGDADKEKLRLGGPGGQLVHHGDKQATSCPRDGAVAEDADFSRTGVPAQSYGQWQGRPDKQEENAGGGGDLGGVSATSKQPATCLEPEEKKQALPARATPTSTPLLPWNTFLSDTFFLWTIKDVLNDNLYKDKVNHIPSKFDSLGHFIAVYSGILIEETRAATCAAIQNRADSQYCRLLSIGECDSTSLFYLDVDLPMARSDDIQCNHVARDYDVCLLSSRSPRDSDLDIMSCSIGLAVGIGRDSSFQKSFRVVVSDHEMFQPEKIKFVAFLTNIKYNMEIARILSLQDEGNKTAIQALLELHKKVGKGCKVCAGSQKDGLISMNKKEEEDVISNLASSLSCAHQSHTEVVWAPVGSIKGCVSTLMKSFLHLRPRVLVCLPSEACLVDFLMGIEDFLVPSDAFSDVLVLNSLRGLENCSNFERAFLENRCQELYCCLRLCKGLLRSMSALLDLSGFHHSPRCPGLDICERCSNLNLLPFSVKLFAERFTDILMHLYGYLVYLVNNASALCLLDENCGRIVELLHLMKQIQALLGNEDMRENCVEAAFELILATGVSVSADYIAKSLNENRMSCIRLITKLNNSLQLADPENRDEVDKICIQQSRIIITSLDSMWKLHGLEIDPFDILIVSGANQIKVSDMLLPLSLPMRHIIFFGDHLHVQTFVQSKVCKEAGFGTSIYERLRQLVPQKQTLTHQCVLHPLILKIINIYFYYGRLKCGSNVISVGSNKELESLRSYFIGIMDVPSMELSHLRKRCINSAALFILLQELSKDLVNLDRKFSVCVLCLSSKEASTVGDQLGTMNEINDRFNLQVKLIGNLEGNQFDVIIISAIVEDDAELNCVSKNSLNVALTSARYCFYMIGQCKSFVKSGGIWKELVKCARDLKVVKLLHTNELIEVMKMFETNGMDHISHPNCAFSSKMIQEFTWVDRPYRTKYILADVRDQRGQPDTCTFQASCGAAESLIKLHNANQSPPQDFKWSLSVDDLKDKYEISAGKKLMSEDITDRGKRRLNVALKSFKIHGVVGRNKTQTKSRIIKIRSYEEVDPRDTEAVTKLLEEGNIMVGHFRISWNYFTLKPDEVYVFDEKKAYIHPMSDLVASHAVMLVGIGHQRTAPRRFRRHMVMQNSEGKLFGIDGIGRVGKTNTIRGIYRLEVEMPKEGLLD